MKISFIEPHLKIYGGIRRIIELSNRLTKSGHDVTIYHSDGSPCEWMECIAKIKTASEVLAEDHDALIFNDPNPVDYKLAHRANARIKIFYVLELYKMNLLKGINPKIILPKNRRTLFVKTSLHSPFIKVSNATWLVTWLKDNLNIDSHLLIGGVNSEIFYPAKTKNNRDEIHILCSGDPRKRKGTPTILDAFEIAKQKEPRIILDTYHGKGIQQSIMAEKYSSADIFVDAQWQAGWNNPVAEAMACKVPVICTNIGGVQDFAYNEETALVIPPGDPKAMATAILRLAQDKKLRATLAENAYQHITCFNWDKSAQRLEHILLAELSSERSIHTDCRYHALNKLLIKISDILLAVKKIASKVRAKAKLILNI
jgi:glycosyltransferase involved in cell wall biosynthesis